MFDHVKFGVSDYAASKAFFLKALQPLGVAVVQEGPPTYGAELIAKGNDSLCLYQTEEKPAHLHLAFTAENRQQVDAFYRAALEAGAKDNGAPGLRPHYHAGYYAAFVLGPDGHNIEVVCHERDTHSATAPASSPATSSFIVRRRPGASWIRDLPLDQQPLWAEHAEFMNALAGRGFIALGGPVGRDNDALHIVHSDSPSSILAALAEDPWENAGILKTVSVELWNILLGDPAVLGRSRRGENAA
jgi:catechol 2,3-dioxygenase-like lactoylglutathione lyase family enzyme/uncharacterized protein YciI